VLTSSSKENSLFNHYISILISIVCLFSRIPKVSKYGANIAFSVRLCSVERSGSPDGLVFGHIWIDLGLNKDCAWFDFFDVPPKYKNDYCISSMRNEVGLIMLAV
jgi:hypothetical protein